jgi:HK97 family phage portal protein
MAGLKGLLSRIWLGSGESRATLANPDALLLEAFGGISTASGVAVTPESAMRLSTVSACIRLISESIGSLPLHVYRRKGDGTREKVTDLAQYRLLHDEPNRMMTSCIFRETLSANVLSHGNAYAYIQRNNAAEPIQLLPLVSPSVRIIKEATSGELAYVINLDGKTFRVNQANIIHVPGLSFDGISGMSPIKYGAQSIGLAIATERFGASFFGNGSMPSGTLELPGTPNTEAQRNLLASWNAAYGGLNNAHKTAVLVGGAKFSPISVNPDEAQFIETRKMQVSEIARWFRVPPHMIGDLERATFSNIEHQALEFVTHTLRPWLVRFEQEFNRKLFPSSSTGQPSDLYCEFNVDGLLRGDIKARGEYYVRGRQWGWLSANDIRRRENDEPIEGGDTYLTPLNMVDTNKDPAADPAADQTVKA